MCFFVNFRIEIILKFLFWFWIICIINGVLILKISVPLNFFKGYNVWLRNSNLYQNVYFVPHYRSSHKNVQIQWNSYWYWMLQKRKLFSKKVSKNPTKRLKSCLNEKCIWKKIIQCSISGLSSSQNKTFRRITSLGMVEMGDDRTGPSDRFLWFRHEDVQSSFHSSLSSSTCAKTKFKDVEW